VRLVLDTNTALSGLLWTEGPPGRLINAAEAQRVELASSTALLSELQGVLTRQKFVAQLAKQDLTVAELFDGYAALVTHVTPTATPQVVERDPDDDHVLACALAAQANAIVSGDRDLLSLGSYEGIQIVTASQALTAIEA